MSYGSNLEDLSPQVTNRSLHLARFCCKSSKIYSRMF